MHKSGSISYGNQSKVHYACVLVVLDDEGTHVKFSYEKYLGIKPLSDRDQANLQEGKETSVKRTRRLFYVCCTRAAGFSCRTFYRRC